MRNGRAAVGKASKEAGKGLRSLSKEPLAAQVVYMLADQKMALDRLAKRIGAPHAHVAPVVARLVECESDRCNSSD